MYEIVYTNRMKRDAKLMKKRGRNLEKLVEVLNLLASSIENNGLPFAVRHKADPLSLETAVSDSRNRTNLHGPFKTAQEAVSSMLED